MRLAYGGNKFFRVGLNISEKFVLGGTNIRRVQIKCDSKQESLFTSVSCIGPVETFYIFWV